MTGLVRIVMMSVSWKSPPEQVPAAATARRPAKPPVRRRANRWAWAAIALVALVVVLPAAVSHSNLRHHLPRMIDPRLPAGIQVGELSLGWFRPVRARGLVIPDLEGKPLLAVEKLECERTLWELLTNPSRPGTIHVQQPQLQIHVRPDGSNLGDLVRRYLEQTPREGSSTPFEVRCTEGSVVFQDDRGDVLMRLDDVDLAITKKNGRPTLLSVDGSTYQSASSGSIAAAGRVTAPAAGGTVAARLEWKPPRTAAATSGPGTVDLRLDRVPIDFVRPWVSQVIGDAAFAGEVTAAVRASWEELAEDGASAEALVELTSLEAAAQRPGEPARSLSVSDVQATLRGSYAPGENRVRLTESTLQTKDVVTSLEGSVHELDGRLVVDIGGRTSADVTSLVRLLSASLGESVGVQSVRANEFRITGALRDGRLKAKNQGEHRGSELAVNLTYEKLTAWGLSSDSGRLSVSLNSEALLVRPVEMPVGAGRIAAFPLVEWGGPGLAAKFHTGSYLEQIELTPELCRGWLRYLSPMLADATEVQGKFSLAIHQGELPITDVNAGELNGALRIHGGQVSAGPLLNDLIVRMRTVRGLLGAEDGSAGRRRQWVSMPEQEVPFWMNRGRVHHKGLMLSIGKVAFVSSGSVGLDESLDLVLELQLPESQRRPLLAALGNGLRIPIRGSFQSPQIDFRELTDFGLRLGTQATEGVLRRLIER